MERVRCPEAATETGFCIKWLLSQAFQTGSVRGFLMIAEEREGGGDNA